MKCVGLVVIVMAVTFGYAQAPDTLWTRTYGGAYTDEGWSVQQTSDGGYIIVGHTDWDIYLLKTNSSGNVVWTKTYGGADFDYGYSVQQTTDGGYIIAGGTYSFGADEGDVYLIKTNSSGDTVWTRTYGGPDEECAVSVQQISTGGYIITGFTTSFGAGEHDVYLIKTDSSGDTVWTKTFGGTEDDAGFSVQQTSEGRYIICGITESFGAGYADIYLIKTNSLGDTLWTQTYGGTYPEQGWSVQQTSDGGYVICGLTCSFGSILGDVYLIKTNSSGDTVWTRTYGGTDEDYGYSLDQTSDGGYVICGLTYSFGVGSSDVYLIKTNSLGDVVWTQTYGGTSPDAGRSVQQTTDDGYIIAGWTYSFGAGESDVYLIKTEPEPGIDEHQTATVGSGQITATIFRGPLQLPENRRCKVFDITGRIVMPETMKPGIYFIEIDRVVVKKVVKIK